MVIAFAFFVTGFSQSIEDYKDIADKLVKAYNSADVNAFDDLFARSSDTPREFWVSMIQDFGTIIAYQYMTIDSNDLDVHGKPICYFKAICSKNYWDGPVQAWGFSLNNENKIQGIRFFTKSKYTDKMLKTY